MSPPTTLFGPAHPESQCDTALPHCRTPSKLDANPLSKNRRSASSDLFFHPSQCAESCDCKHHYDQTPIGMHENPPWPIEDRLTPIPVREPLRSGPSQRAHPTVRIDLSHRVIEILG